MKNNWQDHDPDFAAEQAKHANPLPSRTFLLKWLGDSAGPMTVDEIGAGVGLPEDESRQSLDKRLQAMVRDGQLVQNRRGAYGPLPRMHVVKGRVQGHRDGYGFLIRQDGAGPDIFLNPRQMRELLPGDVALVRISGTDARGRPEGVLVEVVERTMQGIVGRYVLQQNIGYVIPDNPRITHDILIPPGAHGGAKAGQMVVAELTTPPGARTLPVGKIKEVLGDHLAPGMEIEAAIRAHGLPHEWPPAVEQEAAALPKTVSERDCAGRHDFRPLPLVTIDGEDARDFDDAVHAQRHKDGWKLWVAIADVAAYVKPGSALDQEGLLRGNSVYFPERVIPMLPEALSNGLCSLNPHVDRLCMVCEMQIDADGEIQGSRFYEGVMHSQARLTYNQVFNALEDAAGAEAQRFANVLPHLQTLDDVFRALFAARERRGAIDLESTETKVVFGPDRKIERIVPVTRNRAHRIIEECMIAANIEAARYVIKHERPSPHRVHAQPDVTKVQLLREFLAERGLVLGGGDKPKPKDYAKVLVRSRERPDYRLIQTVCLRSLMQARYSAEPTGHFGLALGEYAHFTSPIRRYPDLMLHRAIKNVVHKRKVAELGDTAAVEAQCAHCSTTERRADEATRDVLTWLKCEYMQHRLGESYVGTVTAAVSFGLFVELEGLYIEGLVHISSLKNDYYVHEASQHRLRGERTGRVYTLGQKLRVRVVRVNLDERKIDLEPIEGGPREGEAPATGARAAPRGRQRGPGQREAQPAGQAQGQGKPRGRGKGGRGGGRSGGGQGGRSGGGQGGRGTGGRGKRR